MYPEADDLGIFTVPIGERRSICFPVFPLNPVVREHEKWVS